MEVKEDMETSVKNLRKGGGKPKSVGDVLQVGGAVNTYFWVVDVGDDPPHGPGPGGVST